MQRCEAYKKVMRIFMAGAYDFVSGLALPLNIQPQRAGADRACRAAYSWHVPLPLPRD